MIFNDYLISFIATFQEIVKIKKNWKSASILWSYASNTVGSFFSGHGVVIYRQRHRAVSGFPLFAYILSILVTTGNGNVKMATEVDEESKKLQITEKLQKREEERLHNIQQRKTVKEDHTAVHVCGPERCFCKSLISGDPER